MTSETNPKLVDKLSTPPNQHILEPGSDQARFMAKLCEAAKSATDVIGRPAATAKRSAPSKGEISAAVNDILTGFSLDGTEQT